MSITRRDFLKGTVGVSAAWTIGQRLSFGQGNTATNRPNIIIFYADDLGYGDFSCYGGDIPTPNVDSIARQGIRFTGFYVSYPACTPSRYGLLTGRYPMRAMHGLDKVLMPGAMAHFDASEKLLPAFLKIKGYATGIFGKWHMGMEKEEYLPMSYGFDVFSGHGDGCIDYFTHVYGSLRNSWYINGELTTEEGYSTDLITDHALKFIDENVKKNRPYFAYVPYNAPHYGKTDPANVPEGTLSLEEKKWQDKYPIMNSLQAPQKYIDKFAHVEDIYHRYYSAMVSSMDDNIGRVLDYLKKNNQMENTMIWVISDNGGYSRSFHGHASNGPLKGQKGSLNEGGFRVPGIVCWTGKIKPNQTSREVIGNVDLVPTIGAIVGFSDSLKGLPIDGVDVTDVLFKGAHIERDLIWQKGRGYAMRRNQWKMINGKELYNLEEDIGETTDLAAKYPEKLKELNEAYQKFADSLPKRGSSSEEEI